MEFRMVKSLQEEEPLCNEQNLLVNNKNKDTTAVDFIYCLPFELVPLVFHSFPIQDLFECMNVNALWKCRILNSPTLWHQMTIMKDEEETFIPKLILVGSYIKSYNIIDGCEKTHRSSMDLIASECLSHLQSLELELTWYKRDNGTIATATSMHQLPTLASILSACPGLRRIRMDMPAFRNVDNNNDTTNPFSPLLLLPSSTSKHDCSSWQLTHLHWSIGSSSNSIINNNNNMIKTTQLEVESILSTCPSLTYLKIDPCEEPISLLSIYKKCPPALRFLGLNAEKQYDIFEKYWNGDNDDYYYDGSHSTISSNSGIKALVIPCLDETDWVNLIRTLMMDDQKQLQELVILHDHLYMLNLPQLLQVYHVNNRSHTK
ncbi:hypothetical protein BDA99DRAFT_234585 [Phascolomyces articulosus]|uniref:F-box domain-containing protein n=1 Tax=Phascolomyces articulosus TaxID=60185 RepID=A0AAD5K8H6_9FUNG|nr:hypothetical protein BDA99DRAFT_234585 [Phascolomyces articulosus]